MIYSIKQIFTEFMEDHDAQSYLIPTYQRGYKWSSDENGQVRILLSDIFNDDRIQRKEEYFLNFLTIKKNKDQLEVVDGQQRLTTITILLALITHLKSNCENYASQKLNYESRQNFIDSFIFDGLDKLIDTVDWKEFKNKNGEEYNKQDVYYLFEATHCIYKFLSEKRDKLDDYHDYLSNQVKIVAYKFANEQTGEKLFINVNKGVELTSEELVKAFIILEVLDKKQRENRNIPTYDINEERANLGRRWDNIARWAGSKKIRTFYNIPSKEKAGTLSWLLNLYLKQDIENTESLFERVESYQRENKLDSSEIFERLEDIQLELDDWYKNPDTHNLIGYLMHIKGAKINLLSLWLDLTALKTKTEVINSLNSKLFNVIKRSLYPERNDEINFEDISLPEYDNKRGAAYNILLLLEVWRFINPESTQHASPLYNFEEISKNIWSLEHIFPQTPGDFKGISKLSAEDIKLLLEFAPETGLENVLDGDAKETWKSIKSAHEKGKDFQIKDTDTKDQVIEIIREHFSSLHRFGNLALLTQEVNSSLSNGFFRTKRARIMKAVSSGKFVPFHTYDVFAKLLNPEAKSFMLWTKSDMNSVEKHTKEQLNSIIEFLNN